MSVQRQFPETLRALSIAGPYAYEIAVGEKSSEGRTWRTHYRGLVLLHVSTGRDFGEPQSKDMISSIIGAAEMYDCLPSEEYEDYYDHCMKNPILFEKFIPHVSGARNYWAPKTAEHIKAFNQAWEQIQQHSQKQPRADFKIYYRDGLISISSPRTTTAFQVKDDEIWQTLNSRVQGEEIELTKSEFAALYRKRLS